MSDEDYDRPDNFFLEDASIKNALSFMVLVLTVWDGQGSFQFIVRATATRLWRAIHG